MEALQNLSMLLRDHIVIILTTATFAVLGFTLLTRKADPNAPLMCLTVIGLWSVEIVAKAHLGEAYRPLLSLTDAIGAWIAFELGKRRPSDWIFATYVTLAVAVACHMLWFLVWRDSGVSVNKYKAILNALYAARLILFSAPGVAYVGKALGDYLHGRGDSHSYARAGARK